MVRSPLCSPCPAPRSMSAPGGFSSHGSLHAIMLLPLPLQVLLRIMESSGPWFLVGWIFARGREARSPSLPGSCVSCFSLPLLLGYAGTIKATPLPPSPLSLPPCCHYIIPVGRRSVGSSARSQCYMRV